ncbi:hypothetical protein [Curtobacterium sp. Leaf261]|uniref:hypothetical protein n=1 Tax=Curtobacterium sp. Leaf261 TaxID=1736311 RepID=UPI0006FFCF56|nr:hypothetical protein [Curtobacterium sp. Leaf261]KQO62129.1 hypothetical protein ASF23_09835 [Curtobacterium sp. Leaf261]
MSAPGIDVQVDVGGTDVHDLLCGAPLRSVYVRQWVTFTVFALVLLGTAVRLPAANALERYLLSPLALVALAFTVLSLFIVRGTVAIRRREGLKKLGAALVEHGIVRLDEVEAVRNDVRLDRPGLATSGASGTVDAAGSAGSTAWVASTVIERDGSEYDLVVEGDASDEARVRLSPRRA